MTSRAVRNAAHFPENPNKLRCSLRDGRALVCDGGDAVGAGRATCGRAIAEIEHQGGARDGLQRVQVQQRVVREGVLRVRRHRRVVGEQDTALRHSNPA